MVLSVYSGIVARQAKRRYPPAGGLLDIDGIRIHYRDVGTGPPIVLLHGANSNLRDLDKITCRLAQHYRVIAFDRPGYGFSSRPAGGWTDPARQAALLRRALAVLGVERPILVGHSWSGSLVLAYALAHPDEVGGCVLLAGAVSGWNGEVAWHVRVAGWPLIGTAFARTLVVPIGKLLQRRYINAVFHPEQPPADYAERTGTMLALRPRAFLASAQDVRLLSDFLAQQSQRYDEISTPLLMVTGEDDDIVPAWNHGERLANRLAQARLVELPGAGHAIHQTRDREIASLISDFASRSLGNADNGGPSEGSGGAELRDVAA